MITNPIHQWQRCLRLLVLTVSPLCLAMSSAFAENTFEKIADIGGDKASWGDFNNDGWVDLTTGGQLWRNDLGVLTAVPGACGDGIWGDVDNDGLLDFFSYSTFTLAHNVAGTEFIKAPLPSFGPSSRGATFGDFNGDGFLDLYIGNYESWPDAYYADKIATNTRKGGFTVTWTQGIDAVTTPGRPRPARGITNADWDCDGDLDVYVSNYRIEPNILWRNNGQGLFTDVASTHNALATTEGYYGGHSIGAVWGDFDNDGLLDLFAGNFAHPGQPQSRFLRNRGASADYAFEDMGTGGIFYQESYASPTAGDIDNDGDLDLYFTTVYPIGSGGIANYPTLFRNDGNFRFVDVSEEWGLPKTGTVATYQAAFADYDNDGDLDLATASKLYGNSGNKNHWLKVRFKYFVPGTQVTLKYGDKKLLRQVDSSVGEGNQNDPTLHFGLGEYRGPVSMEIRWLNGKIRRQKISKVDRTVFVSRR